MDSIKPKKDSTLYNLILRQARGSWQKTKARELVINGHIQKDYGKVKKGRRDPYDYNISVKSLIDRINSELSFEATNIYRIDVLDNMYVLRRI